MPASGYGFSLLLLLILLSGFKVEAKILPPRHQTVDRPVADSLPETKQKMKKIPKSSSTQKFSSSLDKKDLDHKKKLTEADKRKIFAQNICNIIASEAKKNKIPAHFFARLIWQESRFDRYAVSRSGAEGIAQFMPGTALLWKLDDPFDPAKALAKSAGYLSWLHKKLGNLGLAAAGYNAGSGRVTSWLYYKGYMPAETQKYVSIITGRSIEDWRVPSTRHDIPPILKGKDFGTACIQLASRKINIKRRRESPQKFTGRAGDWGVNIAQGDTKKAAQRAFSRMKRRFPWLVGRARTRLVTVKIANKASWTMKIIQLLTKDKQAANSLCKKIRRKGGFCLVRSY